MFQNNQKRLFEQIDDQDRHEDIIPDDERSKEFWSEIFSERVNHNEKVECLKKTREN